MIINSVMTGMQYKMLMVISYTPVKYQYFLHICKFSWFTCLKEKWATSSENMPFAYVETKAQFSCVVTAQLISAFVFTT